jgi:ribonuclease G
VIRSEETIAIEFERRLRDVAVAHPDAEAFLVQANPRVSTQFTGHGSRVLHGLEGETGKSFLFEGSEGLALDHFAITFIGTREEVEERALPFRPGDEVLVEIVEPHMYDEDDAVAKIDGYIISIAGAAGSVGEKRMVRIDQVGRTAASALLLDESGEVVTAPPRPAARPRSRPRRQIARESGERDGRSAQNGKARGTRAGSAAKAEPDGEAAEAEAVEPSPNGESPEDGVQSKPRRRGRRGGRRRSAAKTKAAPE